MADNSEVICTCFDLTRGDIIDAIKKDNLQTMDEVEEATEAGSACGSCVEDIEEILKEVNG